MLDGEACRVRILVALVMALIVLVMVTAMVLLMSARAMQDGWGKDAISQIVLECRTALIEDSAMAPWIHLGARAASQVGWDQLVMTLVYMVCRLQWTAVIVFVNQDGLVLDVTVNVPNMVKL